MDCLTIWFVKFADIKWIPTFCLVERDFGEVFSPSKSEFEEV